MRWTLERVVRKHFDCLGAQKSLNDYKIIILTVENDISCILQIGSSRTSQVTFTRQIQNALAEAQSCGIRMSLR